MHAFTYLWHCVTGAKTVTVVLIRDKSKTGYDLGRPNREHAGGLLRALACPE